jgi:hypothetical protein
LANETQEMERIRQDKKKESQSTYTITKFRKKNNNNNQDDPPYLGFKIGSQNSYWKQKFVERGLQKRCHGYQDGCARNDNKLVRDLFHYCYQPLHL